MIFSTNMTGDMAIAFEVTADGECRVETSAAYRRTGREPMFAFFETASGARSWDGGGGTTVRATGSTVVHEDEGGLYAIQAGIRGEDLAGDTYVAAVRNMSWWPNEFTGNATFTIMLMCPDARVESVRGSSEVAILDMRALSEALLVRAQGATVLLDGQWQQDFQGDRIEIHALGQARQSMMTWTTPTESVTWTPAQDERHLMLSGPAGRYELEATDLDSGFLAVAAHLPPLGVTQ